MNNQFIFAVAFSSFAIGFSFAALLCCRITLRPQVRKILRKASVLPLHKAKTPLRVVEDYDDFEIED